MSKFVLSEDDWNALDYFWQEKGDLERWSSWDEFTKKPEAVLIVKAWKEHKAAEALIGILINGMRP